MALANYSDLVTAISSFTHRGDLTSIAPDLITLAEQRIYHGCDEEPFKCVPLRIRIMEEQDSGNASSGVITIPTGYLQTIRLIASTGGKNRELAYLSPGVNASFESEDGDASFYTRVNEGFKVGPSTASYTHDYYKRFDALTAVATTNALMTAHPNVYLFASLVEAWNYTNNMAKAQWAYGMYRSAVNSLQKSDSNGKYGNILAVRAVS